MKIDAGPGDFARDGVACVRGLLEPDGVRGLGDTFESLKQRGTDLSDYYGGGTSTQPGTGRGQTIVTDCCWRLSETFFRRLRESAIPARAATLIGSRAVRIFEDLSIYKSPGAEQPTPWHQDEPQWPVTGRQMISAWFCLDPVTRDTGALRFAAGTHHGPLYRPTVPPERQADVDADALFFDGGPTPSADEIEREFEVRCFDVTPGDVVFFHPRVLHAAIGSAPDHPRRTFSVRMLGDDVRWQTKRSVFHDWLRYTGLTDGEPVRHERFPELWWSPVAPPT